MSLKVGIARSPACLLQKLHDEFRSVRGADGQTFRLEEIELDRYLASFLGLHFDGTRTIALHLSRFDASTWWDAADSYGVTHISGRVRQRILAYEFCDTFEALRPVTSFPLKFGDLAKLPGFSLVVGGPGKSPFCLRAPVIAGLTPKKGGELDPCSHGIAAIDQFDTPGENRFLVVFSLLTKTPHALEEIVTEDPSFHPEDTQGVVRFEL